MVRLLVRAKLVPEFVCSNFAESLRFYIELLGFRVLYSRPEERFGYLERDGAELMIEQSVGQGRLSPRAELA
jgi:lactoylglutathione lyase